MGLIGRIFVSTFQEDGNFPTLEASEIGIFKVYKQNFSFFKADSL